MKTTTKTATAKPRQIIKPLTKFQLALSTRGFDKKPSILMEMLMKNIEIAETITTLLIIVFALYALIFNPYLLFILPAVGAAVFYREHVKFLWWKLKVYVLKRNFYADRRKLYKQGSLFAHLAHKRPKRYRNGAIIWGESKSIQHTKYNRLRRENRFTKKEYILN